MPKYRLWSRILEVSPGQYLCTVVALPDDERARAESDSHVVNSEEVARRMCALMTSQMEAKLTERGDTVDSYVDGAPA